MRIFLTGAAGFIGSSLVERLAARGDEIVGLDNFDETLYSAAVKRRNLAALESHKSFRFIEGDFLDQKLVAQLMGGSDAPEVIVHLGALAGVRPSLAQPQRYQRVNIEGTLNLLEAAREVGVERFVFASSSSVYGAHSSVPFSETDAADRPASPYAATKRAGELLCSNYSDLYSMRAVSLRFFTVYGPRQRPEMAIHKFAKLIDLGGHVPLYGDGTTARDYTYITDILDGVVAAIERTADTTQERYRVYNLGGSQTTTLKRLVELLERALGKRARCDSLAEQPGDVPITFANVERAKAELGYSPRVTIEEGIERFVTWHRQNS